MIKRRDVHRFSRLGISPCKLRHPLLKTTHHHAAPAEQKQGHHSARYE